MIVVSSIINHVPSIDANDSLAWDAEEAIDACKAQLAAVQADFAPLGDLKTVDIQFVYELGESRLTFGRHSKKTESFRGRVWLSKSDFDELVPAQKLEYLNVQLVDAATTIAKRCEKDNISTNLNDLLDKLKAHSKCAPRSGDSPRI